MKRAAFHNLGCKVNSYELEVMQQNLQENGFLIVPFDEIADIYIINTCTVTNIADQKSRKMLHRARQRNPGAIVVAVGCFVQVEEEALKDESIDLAIGNNKKKDLLPILNAYLENRRAANQSAGKTLGGETLLDISRENKYEALRLRRPPAARARAFIKIQDGCNQFCSYCIVPYARGRVRSRPEEAIVAEAAELAALGCREAVLTGINLSAYGSDLSLDDALINLLIKLSAIADIRRIRVSSLEPRIITRDFAEKLAALPKICPHFHLSLQSGCDAVLERMNRHYTAAEYLEKVKILRAAYKARWGGDYEPALTTDIIVGFPGETAAEFAETKDFLRQVSFAKIHVFSYSKRKGTVAAGMPEQVTAAEKKTRSRQLLALNKIMAEEYCRCFIGRKVTVIFESGKTIGGRDYRLGYTAEYVRVAVLQADFDAKPLENGQLTEVVITARLTAEIMAARYI